MNLRQALYFGYHLARRGGLGHRYSLLVREDAEGVPRDRQARLLARLLRHAGDFVPYHANVMRRAGGKPDADPEAYLGELPLLTKEVIRANPSSLQSVDLDRRRWYTNASGGSTGEPIKVIQDRDFWEWSVAVQMLHAKWAGRELGDLEVQLWGSERDLLEGRESLTRIAANWLTRRRTFNAYRMSPAEMERFVELINTARPALIVAYTQAMFELARFVEHRGLHVEPQRSISVTADTLHEHMRAQIERVFRCPILNRYGSRETGDIAGQCPAMEGLHVFPWANYVEIVDDAGVRLPPGREGRIVVTSLINFAMPLIRYTIGDRGVLATPGEGCSCGRHGQVLRRVTGRDEDTFRCRDGTLVDSGFWMSMLEFKDWIRKFQVVQVDHDHIVVRIEEAAPRQGADLEEITRQTKVAMGSDCEVTFEFPHEIPESPSGKYRYTLSRLAETR